jgi:hypothetical protein
MKIEIPEEWLIAITGCHPDTPVKEALEAALKSLSTTNRQLFKAHVGEYVIRQILKDEHEKS